MAVVAAVTARSPSPASPSSGWLWPLIGTAASIAFASAFSLTLRVLRGLAASRTAALHPPQAILVLGGDRLRERLAGRFAALLATPHHSSASSHPSKEASPSSSSSGNSGAAGGLAFDSIFTSSPKPLVEGTLDPLPPAHAAASGTLPVFISSGHDDAADVMMGEGVAAARLRVDNHALDTVTNFTTMLRTFQRLKITHVLVVTSDYHMPRAALLAAIVLRTHGIAFSTVSLPSKRDLYKIKNGARRTIVKGGDVGISEALLEALGDGSGAAGGRFVKGRGEEEGEFKEEIGEVEAETKIRLERDRLRGLLWLVTGWHGAELLRFTRPQRYRLHKQKPLSVFPVSKGTAVNSGK
ncbi:hypothetical protein CLOM_g3277 [Closterium sp. NIES-68]|nr:hypothetical protein CLOM_g3277 [Closterium sp. NIES-68]GJP67991.1 hypothetical protein CLOP_g24747 [Closterium sp. NIES-67]GJP73067.1 hypothetical protein CLOP_g3820 [Closterium sp. NIES-67]